MKKSTKIFLGLTLAVALIDGFFVLGNNIFADAALRTNLAAEGARLRNNFDLLMDRTYSNMRAMATLIANDSEIQSLFLQAKVAFEREGGGAGGPETAALRRRLLERIGPSWRRVQAEFNVRQLHFHFGPGATSFLRVHRPDRFGDDLGAVRFTIVDTNRQKSARAGFETGRVYSGLRGVVPVTARDQRTGEAVHVGALEVGTSFGKVIEIMDNRLDQGVGILLSMDHIRATMWPEFVKDRFGVGQEGCACVIEAQSRDGLGDILRVGHRADVRFRDAHTDLIEVDGTPFAVTHFPLRDYRGERDPDRAAVGAVIFWRDATDEIGAFRRTEAFNVAYGLAAFVIIEILILLAFRFATRRLEFEVANQTRELEQKAAQLEELSVTDRLTGLYNRLKLDASLAAEVERRRRYDRALSVVLLDVDHFKSVNDTHGHQVGDEVLVHMARVLRDNVRKADILGRWGGEEFLIICPETRAEGAAGLAKKLRQRIAAHEFPVVGHKTSSLGVATLLAEETEADLVARADAALYRAKENGRNRVEVAA